MAEGKMSLFYVIATICVLLSLSLIMNGTVSAESYDSGRQAASGVLSGILLHNEDNTGGTLYDVFCYHHNDYFGLRS
ncbi:MAG: hypothetical protein A4E28_02581 [Methanocella sp. PtaU1.Bin125]|nr:MAG: hypothetical protein A4E28_02581 [Methanocella sp. PtaU1.Bin125]